MKRVKILLTEDGNFHFDDLDKKLYSKLRKAGIRFEEDKIDPPINLNNKNRLRRLNDPSWWEAYLDGTIKWVEESYKSCKLCHLHCGVNRFLKKGLCQASLDGEYFDLFVHPGLAGGLDEVLHVMLTGCSLDCFFCHKDQEKGGVGARTKALVTTEDVVLRLKKERFKYVAFSGGNPDENALAILRMLRIFKLFNWPILWETHGCVDSELLSRLCNIVDFFIVSAKFGNDTCAYKGCGVEKYNKLVRESLSCLRAMGADVLVRISIIPGHEECCLPSLMQLSKEFSLVADRKIRIYSEFNLSDTGKHSVN